MKELIALNVVILAGFVLGTLFGASVYHAILKVVQKGVSEVKEYASAAEAKVKSVL